MTTVLDASALLALLQAEPGAEQVALALADSVMSAVNWSEVVQKSLARDVQVAGLFDEVAAAGMRLAPFTRRQADIAGALWGRTSHAGLSPGDRACLAVGLEGALPVLTADSAWESLDIGVEVRLIR